MAERAQPAVDKTKGNPFAYPIYLLGALAGLLSVWSIVGFVLYLYDYQSAANIIDLVKRGPNMQPWPALSLEVWFYQNYGFDLSWLNWKYFKIIRSVLYPFSQYFDLVLIRCYGMLSVVPPLLILCGAAICAGRVNHRHKREKFENVSSTGMHIMLQARFLLYALLTFFLSFSFGAELPILGTIPIYSTISIFGSEHYIWYSSPILLFAFVAIPAFYVMYQLSSHFNTEI